MLTEEMKVARILAGKSTREAGFALGLKGETYRQKELGNIGINGAELALLARLYGKPMAELFPSYQPSEGEALLVDEMVRAA